MQEPLIQQACDWLRGQQQAMIDCLEALVNIDSNSDDKAGNDAVADLITQWLEQDGITVIRHQRPDSGDILEAQLGGTDQGHALLMGHRDTVFPTGTVAGRGYSQKDNLGYGPGVADMKSGLVMNCFVLRALSRLPTCPLPVRALFTADEEIGSPDGRAFIEAAAQGARAVLNVEPGRVSGNVVTGRKGGAGFVINVTGKAAHSGVSHADGASAIEALARKIIQLHALTDYAAGITTNVGTITGGVSRNTVAPSASAQLDIRFVTTAQRDQLYQAIEAIIAEPDLLGTVATIEQTSEFYPLEEPMSSALFALYQAQAQAIGFAVDGEFTGGCSDAGWTASLGIPTLCGLGPVGAKMHTDEEYCLLDTLVPRTQALAATLLNLHNMSAAFER
ncbi:MULTISPECIES: M20 family metallopeptidase [unclassified Halomonas]|uniref:M20 family metallopeptidase n=1 Tax=unclassified Halomonas TaxID=2609666 RepID=UPI0007DA3405|nr:MULTISPECIES: M20 family metallopeptidase [unclassified Halomonas]MBT2786868.1 M20 family metallopeptidase [Halomonas sp. ISL-106]MBT2798479.1 M20 family metallopeptidase [Halomonas sp. ISL-104]OAL58148.1 peptidase M20 [Halomonas sp. ALS9]